MTSAPLTLMTVASLPASPNSNPYGDITAHHTQIRPCLPQAIPSQFWLGIPCLTLLLSLHPAVSTSGATAAMLTYFTPLLCEDTPKDGSSVSFEDRAWSRTAAGLWKADGQQSPCMSKPPLFRISGPMNPVDYQGPY